MSATALLWQCHYPFENKEAFEASFPADFIAEGIDQTRGWFYTLMVLSTALFDKPAFKNLICNGLVLAEDGRKMSKRLKNYPDPAHILASYGADALRLYLINSPVVRADDLAFKERGVMQVLKDVFLPWYHAYRMFIQCANALETTDGKMFKRDAAAALASTNTMDKRILAAANSLVAFARREVRAPAQSGMSHVHGAWHMRIGWMMTEMFYACSTRRLLARVSETTTHLPPCLTSTSTGCPLSSARIGTAHGAQHITCLIAWESDSLCSCVACAV